MNELMRRMLRSPQGALGLTLVGLILFVVIVGPLVAPHDPETFSPLQRYSAHALQCCWRSLLQRSAPWLAQ